MVHHKGASVALALCGVSGKALLFDLWSVIFDLSLNSVISSLLFGAYILNDIHSFSVDAMNELEEFRVR